MQIHELLIARTLHEDGWIDEVYYSELASREQLIAFLEEGSLVIAPMDRWQATR